MRRVSAILNGGLYNFIFFLFFFFLHTTASDTRLATSNRSRVATPRSAREARGLVTFAAAACGGMATRLKRSHAEAAEKRRSLHAVRRRHADRGCWKDIPRRVCGD